MKRRIAYVCADPGVPVFGQKGCSIHVQEMLRAFREAGLEITLFACRLGGSPSADLRDIPVRLIPQATAAATVDRERQAMDANSVVRGLLEEAGPFDWVYERYSLWSHAAVEFAADTGTPSVLEVNAPLIEEQAAHRGLVHRTEAEEIARRVFSRASAIAAVSDGVAKYVRAVGGSKTRVRVIPNGVDPRRFTECQPAPSPWEETSNPFVIGFVGTLKPWHGVHFLVSAFDEVHRRCSSARLLIVGDGPLRAEIEGSLEARGLRDASHFTGAVNPEEVPSWIARMDVAVAPYPAMEGFYFSPLKLFEYMAAGRAVVASDIGQISGVLEDGVTGLLCTPGEPVSLAACLLKLESDPSMRRALGAAARARVLGRHTWSDVATQVLSLAGNSRTESPALLSRA